MFLAGYFAGQRHDSGSEGTDGSRPPAGPRRGHADAVARSTSGTVETEENEGGKTAGSRAMSILRMTDPLARMEQWTALLQSVDADGIKAILGGLDELYLQGFILGEFEAPILHYRLGQLLGVKTLLLNFPLDAGAALSPEHARKMHGWAAANPSEARAWILKQPPGSLRDSLLKSWFEGISRSSPSEAMTWFNQLPEESRAGTLQGLIIAMNNTRGTPGVVQWLDAETASGTSAVPLKEAWSRLAWIVGQTASENPQAAYDFLLEPSRASYLTTDSFNHALRNITGDHPGKAIELLLKR